MLSPKSSTNPLRRASKSPRFYWPYIQVLALRDDALGHCEQGITSLVQLSNSSFGVFTLKLGHAMRTVSLASMLCGSVWGAQG